MAISSRSLAAFAHNGADFDLDELDESEDTTEDEEDNSPAERVEMLAAMLEDYADDLQDLCSELDVDSLTLLDSPLPEEEHTILCDGLATMDNDFLEAIQSHLNSGVPRELVGLLESELDALGVQESDRIAAWAYRVSQIHTK